MASKKKRIQKKRAKKQGGLSYLNYLNKEQRRQLKIKNKDSDYHLNGIINVATKCTEVIDAFVEKIDSLNIKYNYIHLVELGNKFKAIADKATIVKDTVTDELDMLGSLQELMAGMAILENEYNDRLNDSIEELARLQALEDAQSNLEEHVSLPGDVTGIINDN